MSVTGEGVMVRGDSGGGEGVTGGGVIVRGEGVRCHASQAAELRVRAGQAEAAALTVCPRLDTARTSRSIEKEVAQLKRRLEHDQQR